MVSPTLCSTWARVLRWVSKVMASATSTMTTATMALVRQGNYATAMAFGIILLIVAIIVTFLLTWSQQGIKRRWPQS